MGSRALAGHDAAEKKFMKYVSQNILGMLGISAYILADTFFIARAEGARGITALNLVLPVYSLIFAIGSLVASGAAIRFKLQRARGKAHAEDYFVNAVFFTLLFSLVFVAAGILAPDRLVAFLGGDEDIVRTGAPYTRIFLLFAPFFMWNYIWNAFVRNDGDPSLAMMATLSSSLFNIVMDYVLMFPLHLGMSGAALATAVSPLVGIAVCSLHFLSGKNTMRLRWVRPSFRKLAQSCQLGISSFIGEISSGVTTMIFNFLILGLAGNDGIAAYGVVANVAIVATAVFNGVSQGAQPLLSEFHGKGDGRSEKKILRLSVGTALVFAVMILLAAVFLAVPVVDLFNSEHNQQMSLYAVEGMRLYFIGYLFAGINIVGTGYLSATESAKWAFITSILRGFAAISLCAFVMARLFGMRGIWLSFAASELITLAVLIRAVRQTNEKKKM